MKNKTKIKEALDLDVGEMARAVRDIARDKLSPVAHAYMRCVVDPKTAKPARIPTLIGGDPGLTSVMKLRVESTVICGTQNFGFIYLGDPCSAGFYNDRVLGTYSNSATAFIQSTIRENSAEAGVGPLLYHKSPYSTQDAPNLKQYRLVGQSVEIFPVSSALNQNGTIAMLEPASHEVMASSTFDTVASLNRTRLVRGTTWGSPKESVVLNTHPVAVEILGDVRTINPFNFQWSQTPNALSLTGTYGSSAVIVINAAAGTSFRFVVTGVYEFRGRGIPNPRAGITDSRGMNLVLNAYRAKQVSGWIGQSDHVEAGYLSRVFKFLRKLDPLETYKKSKNFLIKADRVVGSMGALAGF